MPSWFYLLTLSLLNSLIMLLQIQKRVIISCHPHMQAACSVLWLMGPSFKRYALTLNKHTHAHTQSWRWHIFEAKSSTEEVPYAVKALVCLGGERYWTCLFCLIVSWTLEIPARSRIIWEEYKKKTLQWVSFHFTALESRETMWWVHHCFRATVCWVLIIFDYKIILLSFSFFLTTFCAVILLKTKADLGLNPSGVYEGQPKQSYRWRIKVLAAGLLC